MPTPRPGGQEHPCSSLKETSIALQLPPGSQFAIPKDVITPKALGHDVMGYSAIYKPQPISRSRKVSNAGISRKSPINPTASADDTTSMVNPDLQKGFTKAIDVSARAGASKLIARLRNRDGKTTSVIDHPKESITPRRKCKKQRFPMRNCNPQRSSKRNFSPENSNEEFNINRENIFDIPLDECEGRYFIEDTKRKHLNLKKVRSKTIAKTNPRRSSNKKLTSRLQGHCLQTSPSVSRPPKDMDMENYSSWRPNKVPKLAIEDRSYHPSMNSRKVSLAPRPMRSTRRAAVDAYEKTARNEVEINSGNTDSDSIQKSILDAKLGLSLTQPCEDAFDKDTLQQKWPKHTPPKDGNQDYSIKSNRLLEIASEGEPTPPPVIGKRRTSRGIPRFEKPQVSVTENGAFLDRENMQLVENFTSQTVKTELSNHALRGMVAKIDEARDDTPSTPIEQTNPPLSVPDSFLLDNASSGHRIHQQDLLVTPSQIIEISSEVSIISSYFSPTEVAKRGKPGYLILEYNQPLHGSSESTLQGGKTLFPQKRKQREDEEGQSREKRFAKASDEIGLSLQKLGSQSSKVYENGSPIPRPRTVSQLNSINQALEENAIKPKVNSTRIQKSPLKLPSQPPAQLLDWPNALDSPISEEREVIFSSNSKCLPLSPHAEQSPADGLEPHRISPGEKYIKLVTAEVVDTSTPLADPFNLVPPKPPSTFIKSLQEKYI